MQLDILKKKINGIQRAQMILVNGKEYHGVIDEIVHVSVHVMHVHPPPPPPPPPPISAAVL